MGRDALNTSGQAGGTHELAAHRLRPCVSIWQTTIQTVCATAMAGQGGNPKCKGEPVGHEKSNAAPVKTVRDAAQYVTSLPLAGSARL